MPRGLARRRRDEALALEVAPVAVDAEEHEDVQEVREGGEDAEGVVGVAGVHQGRGGGGGGVAVGQEAAGAEGRVAVRAEVVVGVVVESQDVKDLGTVRGYHFTGFLLLVWYTVTCTMVNNYKGIR